MERSCRPRYTLFRVCALLRFYTVYWTHDDIVIRVDPCRNHNHLVRQSRCSQRQFLTAVDLCGGSRRCASTAIRLRNIGSDWCCHRVHRQTGSEFSTKTWNSKKKIIVFFFFFIKSVRYVYKWLRDSFCANVFGD